MNKQAPLLTISLLASNRPDTIRRCLDSLYVIREAIPSELILIDTSGSEEIHNILHEYTQEVYPFEWCNDFSKARNEGIKRAQGQWFLFLDDDEWFIDASEVIKFFVSGEYKQYGYANYVVRNYMDIHYSSYSDGYATRMIRIEPDTEFRSKVHEYLAPIRGKRKEIEALVGHSGYIYETEEKKKAHFKRNYDLLLEMLQEEPENVRWKMQMVQELSSVENWKELVDFCKEQIEDRIVICCSYDGEYGNPALGTFYAGYALGLYKLNKYEDALILCQEAIDNKKNTEVLRAYMYFRMAECYYQLSDWDNALKSIKKYLDMSEQLLKDDKLIRAHKMVALIGEIFDDNYRHRAYQTLIGIELKQGSINMLCQYYHHLGLNQKVVTLGNEFLEALSEAMIKTPLHPIWIQFLEEAYENDGLRDHLSNRFRELMQTQKEEFLHFVKIYEKLENGHRDALFAKSYLYANATEKEELVRAYDKICHVQERITEDLEGVSCAEMLQIFNDYMVGVLEYYLLVCPNEWFEEEIRMLPDEARGALYLNQMFGRESSDKEGKLADLRESAKYLPKFGENIKKLATCIAEQGNTANEQLLQMLELMKVKIRGMIEQGMKKEALEIIQEVKKVAPWDEELSELELKLKLE